LKNLKDKLEYYYNFFNDSKIELDPVQFPHKFSDYNNIEIMAFIASVFAYGNIKQIFSTLNNFLILSENSPYEFIYNYHNHCKIKFKHRFYSSLDIHRFFIILKKILSKKRTLKNIFFENFSDKEKNIKKSLTEFSKVFLNHYEDNFGKISNGFKFMFPLPERGSACKRMNLFLRWMVRKDKIDFGIWQEIPTDKLIIPVDTHIAKISRKLKLTKRINISWKMAEEITDNLRKLDSKDPVKYDFALCHLGMKKLEII